MFRFRIITGALLALTVVVVSGAWAAENLKSGPQVGDRRSRPVPSAAHHWGERRPNGLPLL